MDIYEFYLGTVPNMDKWNENLFYINFELEMQFFALFISFALKIKKKHSLGLKLLSNTNTYQERESSEWKILVAQGL